VWKVVVKGSCRYRKTSSLSIWILVKRETSVESGREEKRLSDLWKNDNAITFVAYYNMVIKEF